MISLGGHTLSDHLILGGIDSAPAQILNTTRTLGGRLIATGLVLHYGRELSLQSENHITYANLVAIRALFDAGQPVALIHPRLAAEVLIAAVDLTPHFDFANPAASGADPWYSGTITLLEV